MYAPPKDIETSVYARLPEEFHATERPSAWLQGRGAAPTHSFLEGPSFDRAGNLYTVDLAHGRIFRIAPDRSWSVFADYDGIPNGLKLHRDGRIFVADHQNGLLVFDPETGERLDDPRTRHAFKGLNDLTFADNGDLYVTDQGKSGYEDLSGAVYRLRPSGERDLIFTGLPSPNGLVMDKTQAILHVSVTRSNQVMSFPLRPEQPGSPRARVFLQLSGSPIGPDGMARDSEGNIAVVHAGFGTVWVFSALGEPLWRVRSSAGLRTTNVAYGGAENRSLFITEAEHGVILEARMPVPGAVVYGLSATILPGG
jgi:gluconolactonase